MIVRSHLHAALVLLDDLLMNHGSERDFTQDQYDRIISVAAEIRPYELIQKRIAEEKRSDVVVFDPANFADFKP